MFSNNLKHKSETDQNILSSFMDKMKGSVYRANDMVVYNNNKSVGVVLQVQEDFLKILNEHGQTQMIRVVDINKKVEKDSKAFC